MTDTAIMLYGSATSTCTRRVLMMLEEKGVSYTLVPVNLANGEQKSPEHMARQPFGVVPAITLDGVTMYESAAIVRYLERRFPNPSLTPSSHAGMAMMEQFMAVEYGYLGASAGAILYERILKPMRGIEGDPAALERGLAGVARVFSVLEKTLSQQPHLAGDSFSMADLVYLPALGTFARSGDWNLVTANPGVAAWADRITARPAWQKVLSLA